MSGEQPTHPPDDGPPAELADEGGHASGAGRPLHQERAPGPTPGGLPPHVRYVAEGGAAVDLTTALFESRPAGGGLFMPAELPVLEAREVEGWRGAPPLEVAREVARRLLVPALPADVVDRVVDHALDFPIPLVDVAPGIGVLELFHGPTLAFKDVGARVMARLMALLRPPGAPPVTVLVATSGDTGSAVARAFLDVPGTRTVVLFPEGRVSVAQELQFSTLGRNVQALAVAGSFDDCQGLVKAAFADAALGARVALTSANSINIGRLLPQVLYYFMAWAQRSADAGDWVVSVPSGNLGNLTAGLMARRMGLPVRRFIAATNVNDALPRYLATGVIQTRPTRRTLSSAMDVGDPSNLRRILALYEGVPAALARDVRAMAISDEETRATLREVERTHGYVLDPHGAVAWTALERALEELPGTEGTVLATAHPAKFADTVAAAIGHGIAVPERLASALEGNRRVRRLEPTLEALRDVLLEEE